MKNRNYVSFEFQHVQGMIKAKKKVDVVFALPWFGTYMAEVNVLAPVRLFHLNLNHHRYLTAH